MADEKKRIYELSDEALTLASDDYIAVDSSANGTRKYKPIRIEGQIGDLSTLDTTAKGSLVAAVNELKGDLSDIKVKYGYSSTGKATRDKTVVCADFEGVNGEFIAVNFSQGNSAPDARMNVNSKGVHQIRWKTLNDTTWLTDASAYYLFLYTSGSGGYFTLVGSVERHPYASTPATDGTGSAGSSNDYARGDHVHPSDPKIGNLSELTTEDKTDLVSAINEVAQSGGGGGGSSPSPATETPQDLGTAAVGTSTKYARGDHVHKMPSASDVGALPSSTSIPSTAADVGAIAAPSSPSSGDFLVYNGSAWVAQSLSTWQGGSY